MLDLRKYVNHCRNSVLLPLRLTEGREFLSDWKSLHQEVPHVAWAVLPGYSMMGNSVLYPGFVVLAIALQLYTAVPLFIPYSILVAPACHVVAMFATCKWKEGESSIYLPLGAPEVHRYDNVDLARSSMLLDATGIGWCLAIALGLILGAWDPVNFR